MLTKEQKAAWLARLRDPATPKAGIAFSGKCALYYALPAKDYKNMSYHWDATMALVGATVFNHIASISDINVMNAAEYPGKENTALIEAADWIEFNVPTEYHAPCQP